MSLRQWVTVVVVAALVAGLVAWIVVGPFHSSYICVEDSTGKVVCGGEVAP